MANEMHVVPAALVGTWRDVKRDWYKLCRKAISTMSWDEALHDAEWVDVHEIKGRFIISECGAGIPEGNLLLFAIHEGIREASYSKHCDGEKDDREGWYRCSRDLYLQGLDQFWMVLGLLGASPSLPKGTSYDQEGPLLARKFVSAIVGRWPELCEYDSQFGLNYDYDDYCADRAWPVWAFTIVPFLIDSGVALEEARMIREMDLKSAGEQIRKWCENASDEKAP